MKLTYMKLTNISHMKLRTEPESSARARPRPPAHTHTPPGCPHTRARARTHDTRAAWQLIHGPGHGMA